MQVQEVKNEGLLHAFKITVPANDVEKAVTTRLEEIAKTAKIQGFRPGKVPLPIIRQRYGDAARADVMDKVVSDAAEKTLQDNKLRPAMQPKVDIKGGEAGKDLEVDMTVEVLPEITPMDFSKLSFERKVADVADKTIDEAIERLAKSVREPELVEKPRAAKIGDVAVIDFDGKVDGTAYPGMKGEGHKLELGTKSFIDNFEDQIVGMKPGETKDINVTFPEAYHAAHLAGKAAVFTVKLNELRVHKATAIDDALAKEMGFETLEKLKKRISDDMGADYNRVSRLVLKRQLMDALSDGHDFPVPAGMVDAEFAEIWHQLQHDKADGHLSDEDAKKSEDELKADYRKIAERRVRLGLLLAHLAEKNKIEVGETELRNALIAEVQRYPGQEKAVFDYYMKNRGAIERLRAPLLEEKVVDFVLALAKITDKKIPADDLMKMPESMED